MSEPLMVFVLADDTGEVTGLFRNVPALATDFPEVEDAANEALANPGTWVGAEEVCSQVAYMTVEER